MIGALEIGRWGFLFTAVWLWAAVTVILSGAFVFRSACLFIFLISLVASATRIMGRSITCGGNRRQAQGRDIIRHDWYCLLGLVSGFTIPGRAIARGWSLPPVPPKPDRCRTAAAT